MKTIELTQGKIAIVCDCHYNLVKKFKWCYQKKTATTGYAARRWSKTTGTLQKMQNLILPPSDGSITDHRDGDTLNNQCTNLRIANPSQNAMNHKTPSNNKSGVKGVCWSNTRQMWRASIMARGKQILIGHFDGLTEAAKARRAAEEKYHGEFARMA